MIDDAEKLMTINDDIYGENDDDSDGINEDKTLHNILMINII